MSKLLIIEDSMVIRKIIKHLAQTELTCQYDFAEDFAQARQLIADNDYFLALADLNLPDAPNGEAIEYTLKQGISTVVLTARFSEELRDEMINLGVLDYIYKDNRDSYLQALKLVNQLILNQNTKVLVADDSRTLRNYIKTQCEKLLYPVIEVANGLQALAVLKEQPDIGLLITDYNMPKMNGLALIKQIRQTRSRDDFPIIALSSSSDPTLSARFIKQGANDFLITPFIQEEFQWRILKAMEQIALIQRIRDAANRDYLTNLYNRRYFFTEGGREYQQALKNRTNLTVALLDIDFFKKINDNYGHDCGDVVLVELSRRLNNWFKDMIVARHGGEEFIIMMPNSSYGNINRSLQTFREDIAQSVFEYGENKITVTVSIGVSRDIKNTNNLDDLINLADIALYEAKDSGRNKVMWQENDETYHIA